MAEKSPPTQSRPTPSDDAARSRPNGEAELRLPSSSEWDLPTKRTVLVILYCAFFLSLGTWIMKAFIDQLPRELEEAAAIDGAGLWQTLRLVVLPLSYAGLIATSVFIMVFAWNDFLFAFIFTAVDAKTAPLVISEMVGAIDGVDWGILFAASTVQLAPIRPIRQTLPAHGPRPPTISMP